MHSTDRILTTHAGSLPRPADVVDMVRARHVATSATMRPTRLACARR